MFVAGFEPAALHTEDERCCHYTDDSTVFADDDELYYVYLCTVMFANIMHWIELNHNILYTEIKLKWNIILLYLNNKRIKSCRMSSKTKSVGHVGKLLKRGEYMPLDIAHQSRRDVSHGGITVVYRSFDFHTINFAHLLGEGVYYSC